MQHEQKMFFSTFVVCDLKKKKSEFQLFWCLTWKVGCKPVSSIAAHLQISCGITDIFQPNNQEGLEKKDGEMSHFSSLSSTKLPSHYRLCSWKKFLDEKALRELAVTEWATKGKLFIPVFFPQWRKEVLRSFILYLCSLCRFAKRRCPALCLVIPIICFDFSRCIWNCQPLGFLLLYLDKVGLQEVPLTKNQLSVSPGSSLFRINSRSF